jgi:hypothetical protein
VYERTSISPIPILLFGTGNELAAPTELLLAAAAAAAGAPAGNAAALTAPGADEVAEFYSAPAARGDVGRPARNFSLAAALVGRRHLSSRACWLAGRGALYYLSAERGARRAGERVFFIARGTREGDEGDLDSPFLLLMY